MGCVGLIEGCGLCEAEGAFLEEQGHECGEHDPRWSTLCEIERESRQRSPEYHRLSHLSIRCEGCKAVLKDKLGLDRILTRLCASQCCTEWYCPDCGEEWSSAGPVNCPTCGSYAQYRHDRLRAIRRQYGVSRRRRARW
jgi:hypothetical protein